MRDQDDHVFLLEEVANVVLLLVLHLCEADERHVASEEVDAAHHFVFADAPRQVQTVHVDREKVGFRREVSTMLSDLSFRRRRGQRCRHAEAGDRCRKVCTLPSFPACAGMFALPTTSGLFHCIDVRWTIF